MPNERLADRERSSAPTGVEAGRRLAAGAVDVAERDDRFVVQVDLPGFEPGDVELHLVGDVLTVAAERSPSLATEADRYLRRDRQTASVARSITLPGPVADGVASASLDRGVLTVEVARGRSDSDPIRSDV